MKLCDYCGEEEGTEQIFNQNMDEDGFWDVCEGCKDTIKEQQKLSFGHMIKSLNDSKFNQEYGDKIIAEAENDLQIISEITGKPSLSVVVKKKEKQHGM